MKQYLFVALFAAFIFVCFLVDAVHLSVLLTGSPYNIWDLSISFGDIVVIELGSVFPKLQSATGLTGFSFPTMWFLLHILPCYLTLNYTTNDLSGGGTQVITRLQSGTRWWISKCVLNILAVVFYYLIIYAVIAILCLVSGFKLSFMPDELLFRSHFDAIFLSEEVTEIQMLAALCLMPCVITAVLTLVQMMLTLFIKPVFAYIAVCAYLVSSVLCVHPFFVANFAMPVRSAAVGIYHFDVTSGLIISSVIAAVAIVIGKIRIVRMDIL